MFDAYPTLETRGIFLDMSKALGKVWHMELIDELKSVRTFGLLLTLLKSVLKKIS